jgi:uncharacterized membrane protein
MKTVDRIDEAEPAAGRRAFDVVERLRPHSAAVALIGFYIAHFAWLSVSSQRAFETGAFDVGIFDQGTWLLSRFEEPFVTLNGRNLFGDHMSLVLLPLVPLYWILPDAEVLLTLQAVAIGLAGIPIYLLGLRLLHNRAMASVLLAAFLLHPALQRGNLDEFHPEGFLVLFVAGAVYAAVVWNPRLLYLSAAACMLCKEDSVLIVLPLALWVALARDRKVGLRLAVGSVAYSAVMMLLVMRALGGGPTIYAGRTYPFGGFSEMVETAVFHPATFIDYLRTEDRPFYLLQMLLPTALLLLRKPGFAAISLGVLVFNVVSAFGYQHDINYHYSLVLVPVLIAATIYGISALGGEQWRSYACGTVLACSLYAAVGWGVFPDGDEFYKHADHPEVLANEALIRKIPDDAVVSSDYGLAPHLSHRRQIYMWPNPFRASYWGRFDREGERLPTASDVEYIVVYRHLENPDEQQLLADLMPRLRLVDQTDKYSLYRRTARL